MVMITIGRVAKQAAVGVGVETIGSYEWEGLIEEPPRWVRRAKELGFAPKVFKELMSLQDGGGRRGDEVRAIAEANMRDADQKLAWLQAMRSALYGLVQFFACGRRPTCPILEALNDAEDEPATRRRTPNGKP